MVPIQTVDGNKFINVVLLVPDLDQNLLSVGKLMEKGYGLYFENFGCTIYDLTNENNKLMTKIRMTRSRSFLLSPF